MTTPAQPRITVWNEGRHEKQNPRVQAVYPEGLHAAIAEGLRAAGFAHVQTATLDMPEHGLTEAVLAETDVLTWWGHMAHDDVQDAVVERVYQRVQEGMGLIVLHSGHFSKIFKRLMGTTGNLMWREAGERERVWCVNPAHPIAADLPDQFLLEHEEMYGEPFGIPEPDSLVFVSWFEGGEIFRSGACWARGRGKVFYFRPGHETYPTYFDANIRRVIANAVRWAAPTNGPAIPVANRPVSLEPIAQRD
jgi:trehalose utilization protein